MPPVRSRQQILDATRGLVEADGFSAANVSAVAAAAGVSRQTVYSIFGSREELISQTVLTVALESLAVVTAAVAATESALDYAVELLVAGRREVLRQPMMAAMLRAEQNNPLFDAGMMARATPVAAAQLAPLLEREPGLAEGDRFDLLVEACTRMAISVVLFESAVTRTDEALRAFLRRCLGPVLTAVLS